MCQRGQILRSEPHTVAQNWRSSPPVRLPLSGEVFGCVRGARMARALESYRVLNYPAARFRTQVARQPMLLAASAGRALSHRCCFSLSPRHATLGALGHAGGRNHSREWLLNALRVFSIILALLGLADVIAGAYSRKARTQRGCLLSAICGASRVALNSHLEGRSRNSPAKCYISTPETVDAGPATTDAVSTSSRDPPFPETFHSHRYNFTAGAAAAPEPWLE